MEHIVEVIPSGTPLRLERFDGVAYFKSVRRAQRRGHVAPWGAVYPNRPFNNKKRTKGRKLQVEKERIYAQLKSRGIA